MKEKRRAAGENGPFNRDETKDKPTRYRFPREIPETELEGA